MSSDQIVHTYSFKWNELKLLLQFKINELCAGIGEENMNNEQRQLLDNITSLLATRTNGAPFTLQRMYIHIQQGKRIEIGY
jgi:hypothetical protein